MSRKPNNRIKTIKYRILQEDIYHLVNNTTQLFRELVSFFIAIIKEKPDILKIKGINKQQSAIEKLVHKTKSNINPPYNIDSIGNNIPAYFRRSAINTALGIAQSWNGNYKRWLNGRKKKPPVLRKENNQFPTYFKGMYKEFTQKNVMLKLYTGSSWVWRKVRISTTQHISDNITELSVKLIIKNRRAYIHRSIGKPKPKRAADLDKVVAVDLNIKRTAVMAVVGRDGRIHKTRFINTQKDNRRRKFYLDNITRRLAITKIIPEEESFCKGRWEKVHHFNENLSHTISKTIVEFAKDNNCKIIVFEHLDNLKPEKGSRSRYLNSKLMYWLKGSIYRKTYYKARWDGIWTTRVNPRNTSKLCNRHNEIFHYSKVYGTRRPTQSSFVCDVCSYEADADFNACVNIARRFYSRDYQLKALSSDAQAWQEATRFLLGCMNPLYFGPGKIDKDAVGTSSLDLRLAPYLGQKEVPGLTGNLPYL